MGKVKAAAAEVSVGNVGHKGKLTKDSAMNVITLRRRRRTGTLAHQ
jgi:hypothetical protein